MYTFFNELGVEPVAYVGVIPSLKVDIKDSIHYLYSGDKLNVLTSYVCGRYMNTPVENRYVNTVGLDRRIVQTTKGNC